MKRLPAGFRANASGKPFEVEQIQASEFRFDDPTTRRGFLQVASQEAGIRSLQLFRLTANIILGMARMEITAMRLAIGLIAMALAAAPAIAGRVDHFYGPKTDYFGEGYKETLQADGFWRIVTKYNARDPLIALDVALYRAAEVAREAGKAYVQVLNGYGISSAGRSTGYVYALPTDSPTAPPTCGAKRCYTADVAMVLEALGGPAGNQPGVPKPSVDKDGRQVTTSGYGIGAIAWTHR